MTRRTGRYTKEETANLIKMFNDGYSTYKICRNLNRSQKSIRNNLIRLGLINGVITPVKTKTEKENKKFLLIDFFYHFFLVTFLTMIFVVEPRLNILEIIIFSIFYH